MSESSQFRHYQIVQDADGNNVELVHNAEQVAVLAFDMRRLEYVHCHVLLKPLVNRAAFEEACQTLQQRGHPALARMVEFGEDEGSPFYITGNIDGETLCDYLARQQDLPSWQALMIAYHALETALVVLERGEWLTESPLDSFRIVQTTPQTVQVLAADFRVLNAAANQRGGFDKQAALLSAFLIEPSGVMLKDDHLSAATLAELLGACLASASVSAIAMLRELRSSLVTSVPQHGAMELPTVPKPRALLAPLLVSYQEVARGLVHHMSFQSQRLDMANPYSMRGTLKVTGGSVIVEQVPSARIACSQVLEFDQSVGKITHQRGGSGLVPFTLVNEAAGLTCLVEEIVEGISLAELMRERRCLEAQEVYRVLTGLHAALAPLESSILLTRKLRLEDIFLRTGFAREDSRSAKLLVSKLSEWPAFSIIVRAHPTLASMAGRGTDPAVLLPAASATTETVWHAGWLAALGKFLLGCETTVGSIAPSGGSVRVRETIARLLDDEMAKVTESKPSERGDFLARYARIIQHDDHVKPRPEPARVGGTDSAVAAPAPVALTSGGAARGNRPGIGFAELLFKNAADEPLPPNAPDWARAAVNAQPTLPAHFIPRDDVPQWLKAAVFIGGSMVLGAIGAHLSGDGFWQKKRVTAPVQRAASPKQSMLKSVIETPAVGR